ncbi:MAG: hypothetical protein JWL61_836 [Gemmatimonadetes bacterium]|nr:hypothetical protein [Gemmatimonadota bacterium]
MPTTMGFSGRGTCNQGQASKITLAFGTDAEVIETVFSPGGTFFKYGSSYRELEIGRIVMLSDTDTAFVTDGILRLRQRGLFCNNEEFVARALP